MSVAYDPSWVNGGIYSVPNAKGNRFMDWNSFNRELQNRVSDPGTRYMLGLIYERLLDISKQTDVAGTVMLAFAETMKGFMEVSEVMDDRMKVLHNLIKGRADGVSFESVPLNDEE